MLRFEFINPKLIEAVDKINLEYHEAHRILYNIWINDMLFKWHWWVSLGLAIIPWLIWIKFRKKDSTSRLLYAGFVIIMLSYSLDVIGMALGLWGYNSKLFPTIPPFVPWDFSLIPVFNIFAYQIKPQLNPIIKAIIVSTFEAFAGEPILAWTQLYNPKHWEFYYSFPIFAIIYLIGNFVVGRDTFKKLTN